MGVKKGVRRGGARARQVEDLFNVSTFSGGMRISRAALLAGASLVALGAFAAPDRALAACSGSNQTIVSSTTGPLLSNGGAITVTTSGIVTGGIVGDTGLPGILVTVCPATTIGNSGTIVGGAVSIGLGN